MQQQENNIAFLPTQPAGLPYKGAPRTVQDIIMRQVQFEDKGLEGFVHDESHRTPEAMKQEVLVNCKKGPVGRNWGVANITKFANAMMP